MYNVTKPALDELPTSKRLLRSTFVALIAAVAILFAIVLPSEYGFDPTGVGRMLGLTEMGEIKTQLAEEAAIDAEMDAAAARVAAQLGTVSQNEGAPSNAGTSPVSAQAEVSPPPTAGAASWRNEMQLTLTPGQGSEIKLSMKAGERAEFSWVVEGGVVNFDTHGDGGGRSISYEKGRSVPSGEGIIEADFDGNHGWFWRNRGDSSVTVIIRARGQYAEMTRVM